MCWFICHESKKDWSVIESTYKKYSARVLQFTLILSIFHLPGTAYSCAVCFSGSEESLQAYYLTTVFLTLLPVLMLVSIGYWIYRKHRENWKDQTILITPLHCHLCTSINCLSAEPFNKNLHWKNNSGHSINSWVVQYQVNHHTCNWNIQPQRQSYPCYFGVLRKIACCCKINGGQNHRQD